MPCVPEVITCYLCTAHCSQRIGHSHRISLVKKFATTHIALRLLRDHKRMTRSSSATAASSTKLVSVAKPKFQFKVPVTVAKRTRSTFTPSTFKTFCESQDLDAVTEYANAHVKIVMINSTPMTYQDKKSGREKLYIRCVATDPSAPDIPDKFDTPGGRHAFIRTLAPLMELTLFMFDPETVHESQWPIVNSSVLLEDSRFTRELSFSSTKPRYRIVNEWGRKRTHVRQGLAHSSAEVTSFFRGVSLRMGSKSEDMGEVGKTGASTDSDDGLNFDDYDV